ncbi:MAG: PilZ domain-containing protein [Myxococcota bacterium]
MHDQADLRTDPYLAPDPARPAIVRWSARLALLWGLVYVTYRAVFTLGEASPVAAGLLLAAEALALVVFGLRVRSASASPVQVADVPDAPIPDAVAVIDAAGASIDELRTTLVSCRRVRGLDRIVVADPSGSRWLRTIAERFSASVVEDRPLTVLAETNAVWALHLRAGDLPMPDALEMVATVASAPDVGVVQFGVEEADPSSYEHDPRGRWSVAPFEHQVVRPSLAARGSIPWFGDVPALVRPVVIRGAEPAETTVDLGLHAIRLGYRVTLVGRTLARVRGPQSLGESLRDHARRTARLRTVALGRLAGLPTAARVAHRTALVGPLAALQRVLLIAAAVLALGFGELPLTGPAINLLALAVPAYLLRWNAQLLLGRGRLGPFSIMRSDLRTLGVDLTFGLGDPGAHQRQRFLLLAVLVASLDVAVLVTAFAVWRDWGDRLPAGPAAVALGLTAGFLAVAMEVLLDAMMRRQRRHHHRVRLGLVTCSVQGCDGQLHDLSTGGAGVIVAARPDELPEEGSLASVSFRIPDAAGAWRQVDARVQIAHVAEEAPGECRIGLAFDDPTDSPLDPVVEFLTIDRRLVALGRRAHETV